ncbi:hypothetical protein As57867_006132, partial [Aphanomyces stellatus]
MSLANASDFASLTGGEQILPSPVFPINAAQPEALVASTSANFDFYVLSQSWQPYFCTTGNFQGCRNPTPYMSTKLTIHGLWPNNEQGPNPAD